MIIKNILDKLSKQGIKYEFVGNQEEEIKGYSCSKKILPNSVLLIEDSLEFNYNNEFPLLVITDKKIECQFVSCLIVEEKEDIFYQIIHMFFDALSSSEDYEIIKNRFPDAELELGENIWIASSGVTLAGKIKIGKNVIIKSGAVIGQEGYEFLHNKQGNCYHIPSQGGIIIGDNVEIGANTCVDKGVYGDTIIENNVKISNLCQIAHDVKIGSNTMIATKVSISSFTEVGRNCRLSAGVTIKDNIKIDDDVFIGMGSVVTESVLDKASIFGNPAVEYKRKQKLLKISDVNKTYENDAEKTLNNISFEIASNEFISIVGPSGCGKSTLLKIMAGLLDSDSGQLISKKKNGINIGMIFQEDTLLPWLTVEKNIGIGLKIQKSFTKKERKEKTRWAARIVGMEGYEKYYPHQLSGGMKKRVAIARSLVLNSELLLMDEPFGALDAITKQKIQEDLLHLQKENGFSVCMVTHDIDEAITLSDRIIIVSGKPAEIKTILPINLIERENRNSMEFLNIKQKVLSIIEKG